MFTDITYRSYRASPPPVCACTQSPVRWIQTDLPDVLGQSRAASTSVPRRAELKGIFD